MIERTCGNCTYCYITFLDEEGLCINASSAYLMSNVDTTEMACNKWTYDSNKEDNNFVIF